MSIPFDLAAVSKVTFFKRDELTTDLICCEVEVEAEDQPQVWSNYEETDSWNEWIEALSKLPGFANDWFAKVSQPAFAATPTVAFKRSLA